MGASLQDRASRATPSAATRLRHSATIARAEIGALIRAYEAGAGVDADERLHALLPGEKVISPPRYSGSLDAASDAVKRLFPLADWRKFTPTTVSVFTASPYNAAAQTRYDGHGPNEAARLVAATLKAWLACAEPVK